MSLTKEYIEKYAEYAMEQQKLYGIPASITLAQAILESSNGQSQLTRECNNHFGIKATSQWIKNGGEYGIYTDDKPNEKFCKYKDVSESYTHHSEFLKQNSRYAQLFTLSSTDYKGWATGLQKAGYASSDRYASSLIKVIEDFHLYEYDNRAALQNDRVTKSAKTDSTYSFPIHRTDMLVVTSPYGSRQSPTDSSKTEIHKGIDIRCKNEPLYATESNGKIVGVNHDVNKPGGLSISIEYPREDGTKYEVTYCHLSSIDKKVGDTVNAGEEVGVSGNTGRSTGPHLHLGVKLIDKEGTSRQVDPASYLAEIAQKGNLPQQLMYDGKNLLADYAVAGQASSAAVSPTDLSSEDWMKKLLSSEDSGLGMGGDPIIELIVTLATACFALASKADAEVEAKRKATESALRKEISLGSVVPGMKLELRENGQKPILHVNGEARELTSNELNRFQLVINDKNLTIEERHDRLSSLLGGIAISMQQSQSFDNGRNQSNTNNQQINIK